MRLIFRDKRRAAHIAKVQSPNEQYTSKRRLFENEMGQQVGRAWFFSQSCLTQNGKKHVSEPRMYPATMVSGFNMVHGPCTTWTAEYVLFPEVS